MDEIDKFRKVKQQSEKLWKHVTLDSCYGFQIQEDSKWKEGLTDNQINSFEEEMGFSFPEILRNYYKVMNGLDKPGINVYAYSDIPFAYQPKFYSYPDDVELIKEYINWIFDANNTNYEKLSSIGASRIFPIYGHRFILLDIPGNPILSMHGDDIIYWCKDIFQLFDIEISGTASDYSQRLREANNIIDQIKFWI